MNNSHYFPIWRMTAVLKVNLTSEVVTEWWTCVIESRTHHLLFDVILVCGSVLSVSDKRKNTQLFLLALSPVAARIRPEEMTFNNRKAAL